MTAPDDLDAPATPEHGYGDTSDCLCGRNFKTVRGLREHLTKSRKVTDTDLLLKLSDQAVQMWRARAVAAETERDELSERLQRLSQFRPDARISADFVQSSTETVKDLTAKVLAAESRCHELEAALQNAGICPTCQLPRRRETVGLVCQTCGWDYAQGEKP